MMISKPLVLGVVLARSGSKTIPNKNIKKLGGIPLVGWVGNAASESKLLTELIISTDSMEYQDVAKNFGINSYFLRPENLAGDIAKSIDCLQHAVTEYEIQINRKVDYIVELMCTNINKDGELIDKVIQKLLDGEDSVITVQKVIENHPKRLKIINDDGYLEDIWEEELESRRQDLLPEVFIRNGNIYGMSRKFLMEDGLRYHPKKSFGIIQNEISVNLDTPLDWMVAEAIVGGK